MNVLTDMQHVFQNTFTLHSYLKQLGYNKYTFHSGERGYIEIVFSDPDEEQQATVDVLKGSFESTRVTDYMVALRIAWNKKTIKSL